jgi:hypothetical protein
MTVRTELPLTRLSVSCEPLEMDMAHSVRAGGGGALGGSHSAATSSRIHCVYRPLGSSCPFNECSLSQKTTQKSSFLHSLGTCMDHQSCPLLLLHLSVSVPSYLAQAHCARAPLLCSLCSLVLTSCSHVFSAVRCVLIRAPLLLPHSAPVIVITVQDSTSSRLLPGSTYSL